MEARAGRFVLSMTGPQGAWGISIELFSYQTRQAGLFRAAPAQKTGAMHTHHLETEMS